jgi:hypothetical protein
MGGFEFGYAALLLGLLAPAATLGGVCLTIRYHLRQRLDDRLKGLLTEDRKAGLRAIMNADPKQLAVDEALAEPALSLLLQFQQVASSVSSSPSLWDHALAHDDHQLIRSAVQRASLLIQVVRSTGWKFKTQAWNGRRHRAFTSLLRAVRVRLPAKK